MERRRNERGDRGVQADHTIHGRAQTMGTNHNGDVHAGGSLVVRASRIAGLMSHPINPDQTGTCLAKHQGKT